MGDSGGCLESFGSLAKRTETLGFQHVEHVESRVKINEVKIKKEWHKSIVLSREMISIDLFFFFSIVDSDPTKH